MKKSIKISGDGFISEGEYDVVKIMGDVSAIGNVYAREVKINGDAEFRGNLDFVKLNICGNTHINGNLKVGQVKINGDIDVETNIYAKEININGLVKVRGNIECENITIKGSIQCDGILQAQSVSIYPYSDSYCNEIKSSKIEILKYKRKYTLNLYKVNHGKFNCKSMKGDDIKLENSDVEYIEYTKNLNISDDCKVEKSVKIS
nr:polymer-forming cytoskeletal protein [uncultured Romboutsia sp.]